MDELSAGYKTLVFLIGSGGATTIIAAYLGWRSNHQDHAHQAPVPIQIESPWLIQNLLTMARDIQEIRRAVDGLTKAISDLSSMIALKRRDRD